MKPFTSKAERHRWLRRQSKNMVGFGRSLWNRYAIYIMNTDEAPKTFDEWLNS